MRHLLTFLLFAASAFAQTATITDTIATPFAGTFSGTVTVTLNSPALAQPLYSGNVTLSGWTQTVTVTAGAFTLTLYTNDLITPGGTSYTATYAPTSGSGWKETWIVPSGATTIREIRSTTVPSPSVRFTPSQITQAGATLGQGLKWDGSKWAPADVVANPMTTNGDLITRLGGVPVRVGIGSTNQVLTVSGGMPVWASGITGNASTASALAANGANCTAGSFPLGVDASGNAEGCTAAVTASTGLSDSLALVRNNQANTYTAGNKQTFASNATTAGAAFGGGITADPSSVTAGDFWYRTDLGTFGFRNATAVDALVAGGRALSTVGSVPFVTSSGVLGQSANLFWSSANNRLGINTSSPSAALDVAGDVFIRTGNRITADTFENYTGGITAMTVRTGGNQALVFGTNSTERARFVGSTGNLLLGTTTDDGTNRLQVAGGVRAISTTATGFRGLDLSTSDSTTPNSAIRWYGSDNFVKSVIGRNYILAESILEVLGTDTNASTSTLQSQFSALSITRNRNTIIGPSPVEGNFRLDVNSSGSSGTLRIYDQTPTTGSTSLVVRAGAGQGSNNLTTWQNSGGSTIASISSSGDILARIHTWSSGTEGTCDATLRGQVVMVQGGAGVADRLRLCRKDATDTYLWAPVDNNVALQVISAGPTATVTNQVRRVYVDPASVIASLTLTLPAAPLDADRVEVYFGGTLANQAAVVTTLSIAPNTGHAISQFNAPANAFGGDMVTYEYRAAAARWYRIQ